MRSEYWRECIAMALEEVGLRATEDQINQIADDVAGAHEMYSQAHGYDQIPNPFVSEIRELKTALEKEKQKSICRICNGRGSITSQGPYHSATSSCHICYGAGRI